MIYDALEQAYVIANANFQTDYAALSTAKSVTALAAPTIIKRQRAETSRRLGEWTTPTLGVVVVRAASQAKDQQKRDTQSLLIYDYFATGTVPRVLAAQVELAAEALLRSIDRLAASGAGVFGAGELQHSISIELTEGFEEDKSPQWWRRAQVGFPIRDRDDV